MKKFSENRRAFQLTPWLIIGSAVILLLIVVILAIQNYNREKRYMSQILSEKGAALIRAVEAGTRTGMMGMMWGMEQVQLLLEETARIPGVLYMTVTDKNGQVLAHNDRSKVGTQIQNFVPQMNSGLMQWHIVDSTAVQSRAFEVYREFKPVNPAELRMHDRMGQQMPHRGMMKRRQRAWGGDPSQIFKDQVIIAGLDITPFENARAEDIRNTAIISAVLFLLGIGGFVSMFWAHSYRSAKRSLQDTSAFANEVVAHLPVGLIATDRNGRITFFNSTAQSITGIHSSEARGKNPDDILPSEWCGLKSHLQAGQPVLEKEMECSFKDNRNVPLSVSATRIVNEADQFVGNIMILRDLGEIRRLQDQVRRQEKLAALGGLAAGVAHEIRNPLGAIKGIASFFKSQFGK